MLDQYLVHLEHFLLCLFVCLLSLTLYISMHILHTVIYNTFPGVLIRGPSLFKTLSHFFNSTVH